MFGLGCKGDLEHLEIQKLHELDRINQLKKQQKCDSENIILICHPELAMSMKYCEKA